MHHINAFKNESGFSLVELSSAIVSGGILLLTFFTLMVYGRNETDKISENVKLVNDSILLDGFFSQLSYDFPGDSINIFIDSSAEDAGTTNLTGSILKSSDSDGNSIRFAVLDSILSVLVNGTNSISLDQQVTTLAFTKDTITPNGSTTIQIAIDLLTNGKTKNMVWKYACRN